MRQSLLDCRLYCFLHTGEPVGLASVLFHGWYEVTLIVCVCVSACVCVCASCLRVHMCVWCVCVRVRECVLFWLYGVWGCVGVCPWGGGGGIQAGQLQWSV